MAEPIQFGAAVSFSRGSVKRTNAPKLVNLSRAYLATRRELAMTKTALKLHRRRLLALLRRVDYALHEAADG